MKSQSKSLSTSFSGKSRSFCWKSYWRKRLELLPNAPQPLYIIDEALVYILLGENEKAIAVLEKQLQARELTAAFIKIEPIFEPLKSNPKFESLIKQ